VVSTISTSGELFGLIVSRAVLRSEKQYTPSSQKPPDVFEEIDSHLLAIYPSISFQDLEILADKVYHRYMTTQAYESALGDTERSPERYGVPGEEWEAIDIGAEKLGWKGDRQMANLVLRMRDGLWYHEFCHGIIDGDIGRVSEIIKVSVKVHDSLCLYSIFPSRYFGLPFGVPRLPIMVMSCLSMLLYSSMSTPRSYARHSWTIGW
jgi:hypothetical protein